MLAFHKIKISLDSGKKGEGREPAKNYNKASIKLFPQPQLCIAYNTLSHDICNMVHIKIGP